MCLTPPDRSIDKKSQFPPHFLRFMGHLPWAFSLAIFWPPAGLTEDMTNAFIWHVTSLKAPAASISPSWSPNPIAPTTSTPQVTRPFTIRKAMLNICSRDVAVWVTIHSSVDIIGETARGLWPSFLFEQAVQECIKMSGCVLKITSQPVSAITHHVLRFSK